MGTKKALLRRCFRTEGSWASMEAVEKRVEDDAMIL